MRAPATERDPAKQRYVLKGAANAAFDVATALEIITFQSDDHAEALAAIAEKRQPVFEGR